MPSLTALDRWFFQVESAETPSAVAVLMTLELPEEGPDDYMEHLVEDMRNATAVAPPFTWRVRHPAVRRLAPSVVELDPDEVDLDYHFRHSALPRPGGEIELGRLVARLFSRPLDPAKPLWECHIIEGLEGDRFAWFFKVHHAFLDGMGAIRLFERMLDTDPSGTELRPIWTLGPERGARGAGGAGGRPSPSVADRARKAGGAAREAAAGAFIAVRRIARDVQERDEAAVRPPYTAPPSVLNRRITQNRRFATQRYELERIRALAKHFGVTINDIFLALCAGGLRTYLSELGALPDESLVALLPVSIRPTGDAAAGNAISSIFVRLPTEIADPAERVAAIRESSVSAKERLEEMPKAAIELYPMLFTLPQTLQQMTRLAGRTRSPYNVLLSNVPGPTETLYMRGSRLEAIYPLTIVTHGMALNISTGSVSGWLNLGFTACRETLPRLQRLAVQTGEALAELEAVAGGQG